jgi:hypothetical protein
MTARKKTQREALQALLHSYRHKYGDEPRNVKQLAQDMTELGFKAPDGVSPFIPEQVSSALSTMIDDADGSGWRVERVRVGWYRQPSNELPPSIGGQFPVDREIVNMAKEILGR